MTNIKSPPTCRPTRGVGKPSIRSPHPA